MNASEPTTQSIPPLAGKTLYSPAVIAAYTALANIPVGCILYGLNLQARGSKSLGRLLVVVGAAGIIGLAVVVLFLPTSPRSMTCLGIFAAFCFYQFEKAPVAAALRDGASLARWWPPALYVIAGIALLFGMALVVP